MSIKKSMKALIKIAIKYNVIDFEPGDMDNYNTASIGELDFEFLPPEPEKVWDKKYMKDHINDFVKEIYQWIENELSADQIEYGYARDYLFSHIVKIVPRKTAVKLFKKIYLENKE